MNKILPCSRCVSVFHGRVRTRPNSSPLRIQTRRRGDAQAPAEVSDDQGDHRGEDKGGKASGRVSVASPLGGRVVFCRVVGCRVKSESREQSLRRPNKHPKRASGRSSRIIGCWITFHNEWKLEVCDVCTCMIVYVGRKCGFGRWNPVRLVGSALGTTDWWTSIQDCVKAL